MPSDIADHINGDRLDNRRENLRITDHSGNSQNVHVGEFRGTTLHPGGKWQAYVKHKRKYRYLGLFSDRSEAARVAAAKRAELGFLASAP